MVKEEYPKYYFKFLSFGEHTIDALEKLLENYIYTPLISQLNDPFEGIWYNNKLDTEYPAADKEFRDSLIRRRVYCLCSNDSVEFPFTPESIVMWSHYADSHKGFCIMFSREILETEGQEKFSPRRIEYSDSLSEKTGEKDRDMTILCQKSKVWQSEHEVRLCFRAKNEKGEDILYRQIPNGCILAIFAGCRISKMNDCMLYGLAQKLGCKYHRLKLSNQTFELEESNKK